jgi:hypothetical protein
MVEEISGDRDRASLQQYGDVGTWIQRFCRFLVRECPQNVVLVCHEQYQETPEGQMLMPQTGGKQNPMVLCALVDVIGYAAVITAKDKPTRYVAQVVPGAGRYAGHRGGILGDYADMDLARWCQLYANLSSPQKES